MGLVGEAGGQGDLGQLLALAQALTCQADALVDQVGVGREAVAALEAADQMGR